MTTEQPVPQPLPTNPVPDLSRESVATGAPAGITMTSRRRSVLPIALPLALLASAACLYDPRLEWLILMATVVWGVFRYQQRFSEMSAGIGARIGVLTGFLAFVFSVVLLWLGSVLKLLPTLSEGDRQELIRQIQQAAAKKPDPRAQEMVKWLTTNQGLMVLLILALAVAFIFFLVSATVTGAITGALVKKKPQQ